MESSSRSFFSASIKLTPMLFLMTLVPCVLVWVGLFARLWWVLELTTHFTAYYAAALLIAAVGWGIARRRYILLLCVVSFSAACVPLMHHWFPRQRAPTSEERLRVMSLNVLTSNRSHDQVLSLIESEDPDLLLLVEVDQRWIDALAPLEAKYAASRHLTRPDNFGVAYFSKLPAEEVEIRNLGAVAGDEGVPTVFAQHTWQEQPLHFVGAHTLPPSSPSHAVARNVQLAEIAAHTRDLAERVIVAGDLNITPYSPYFADLLYEGKLIDSAVGFGLQPTWVSGRGVVRIPIDHVLHDQSSSP